MKKIINILLTLLISILFVGCSSPTPTNVATDYMKTLKSNINENYISTLDLESLFKDDEETKALFISMIEGFEYKIDNEVINGDLATVDVTITTYDLGNMYKEYLSDYLTKVISYSFISTEEEMNKAAKEIIQEKVNKAYAAGKTFTSTITLQLNKDFTNWTVDEEYNANELLNACTGGLKEARSNINISTKTSSN